MQASIVLFASCIILCSLLSVVLGHGYLIDPAARNSCYMLFKQCRTNYDLNGLNCGGRATQISNGGKCGVCGDSYSSASPLHVSPGKYATGFITKSYKQGQVITVKIRITANHKGWFEYRVGDIGTPPIKQANLIYLLKSPSNQTRFPLSSSASETRHELVLPRDLSCDHCVLQWWWKTGNSWGCDGGGCGLGHGHQETFVNCADIRITAVESGGTKPTIAPTPSTNHSIASTQSPPTESTDHSTASTEAPPTESTNHSTASTQAPPTDSTKQTTPSVNPPSKPDCKSTGPWAGNVAIDNWCKTNCAAGFCPPHMCTCGMGPPEPPTSSPQSGGCKSTGPWAGDPGIDKWCEVNCAAGFCPSHMCICAKNPPDPPTSQPHSGRCKATGPWTSDPAIDNWCKINCAAGFCPSHMCICGKSPPEPPKNQPKSGGCKPSNSLATYQAFNEYVRMHFTNWLWHKMQSSPTFCQTLCSCGGNRGATEKD